MFFNKVPGIGQYYLHSIHQSAYLSGHSTETVLLRILQKLLTSLSGDTISTLLVLDLSATFDVCGTALNRFNFYLSDPKQKSADKQKSAETSLDFSVPQGPVLGPALFTLYTAPLTCLIALCWGLYCSLCIQHHLHASSPCAGACTVHFVYSTTYMPHRKTLHS